MTTFSYKQDVPTSIADFFGKILNETLLVIAVRLVTFNRH